MRQFAPLANELTEIGRRFYARGWALGTSGNFSVALSQHPLRLAITASSVHKGTLRAAHILQVDDQGEVVGRGVGKPSAETLLHIEIMRRRGKSAGAVLHTHSIWSTILSGRQTIAHREGFWLEGFEMLKGLDGVRTHEHREWVPIVENDQDMKRLAVVVGNMLERNSDVHAFLLRRHGMYTWGTTLADAERHVEILEFLFETIGRTNTINAVDQEVYHGAVKNP